MDNVSDRFIVFFEEPFWVGVWERRTEGTLSVCKVTFGAEPKDDELYTLFEEKQQKRKEKHRGR